MAGDVMTVHPASPWTIAGKLCLITGAAYCTSTATCLPDPHVSMTSDRRSPDWVACSMTAWTSG